MFDLKSGRARDERSRQDKKEQSCHRTEKRRPSVAKPLKRAGGSEDNSGGYEIEGDDPRIIAAEGNHSRIILQASNKRGGGEEGNQGEEDNHKGSDPDREIDSGR